MSFALPTSTLTEQLNSNLIQNSKKKIPTLITTIVFIAMTFTYSGPICFYDFPQLFEATMIQIFDITTFQISLLYSSIGLISIILSPFGGLLTTRIGLGESAIIWTSISYFGTMLCYWSISTQNFSIMILGRVIYGVGEEFSIISRISIAEKWFSGKFLTLAMSVNRINMNIFQSGGSFFIPEFYEKQRNMESVLFVYSIIGFSSVFASVVYYLLEKRYEEFLVRDEKQAAYMSYQVKISDFKQFPTVTKLFLSSFGIVIAIYYQFTNIATDLLVHRFGFSYVKATKSLSIMPIVSGISVFITSAIVTKTGKRGFILSIALFIVTGVYFAMYLLPKKSGNEVIFLLTAIGIVSGVYSSLTWSSLTMTVPKQAVSFIIGIGVALMSVGFTIFPPIFGLVVKARDFQAYQNSLKFLIGMGLFGAVFTGLTAIFDFKRQKMLHFAENDERFLKLREKISVQLWNGRKSVSEERATLKIDSKDE